VSAEGRDSRIHAVAGRRHGVAERDERVRLETALGERLCERAFRRRAADRFGVEAEHVAAQVFQLFEIEQAFELGAQREEVSVHGSRFPVSRFLSGTGF